MQFVRGSCHDCEFLRSCPDQHNLLAGTVDVQMVDLASCTIGVCLMSLNNSYPNSCFSRSQVGLWQLGRTTNLPFSFLAAPFLERGEGMHIEVGSAAYLTHSQTPED